MLATSDTRTEKDETNPTFHSILSKIPTMNKSSRLSFMAQNLESHLVPHLGPIPLQHIGYISRISISSSHNISTGFSDQSGRSFLASKGIDPSKIDLLLQQVKDASIEQKIAPQTIYTQPQPQPPSLDIIDYYEKDLDSFRDQLLKHEHDNLTKNTANICANNLQQDWKRFISSFISDHVKPIYDVKSKSIASGPITTLTGRKGPDPKANAYANIIISFNESRIKQPFFPLCEKFCELTSKWIAQDASLSFMGHMSEIWRLLAIITDEKCKIEDTMIDVNKIRIENTNSLKQPYDSQSNIQLRMIMIKNSISYLNKSYIQFMDRMILQFPKEAQLGGKPSIQSKVRAYLNIKYGKTPSDQRIDIVQGIPIWATVFYLLRCGDNDGLISFTAQYETFFRRSDMRFPELIKAFHESGYIRSSELKSHISKEFSNMRKNESVHDPFHILFYGILGRCGQDEDGYHPPSIIVTMEDWIWYQLCMIQEDSRSNEYHLSKLQKTITELGPDYFCQKNDPLYYLKVCILSGLYEHAIQYLSSIGESHSVDWTCEAVHICIVLMYNGLIKLNEEMKPFLLSLLERHWMRFIKTSSQVSFHYILLLNLLGDDGVSLSAMKNWILTTKEYAFAFGKCSLDGTFTSGNLDKWSFLFPDMSQNGSLACTVALESGSRAESEGNYEDAIVLFHIGGDHQRVISLLCQQISDGLTLPLSIAISALADDVKTSNNHFDIDLDSITMTKLDNMVDQTHSIITYYNNQLSGSDWILQSATFQSLIGRVNVLTSIYQILKAVSQKKWHIAINALTSCQLFTFDEGIIHEGIWKVSDSMLARHIPSMFVLSMKAISGAYHQEERDGLRTNEYRKMSRQLMVMLGRCVALRMPADIYAIMNQYDASMNS